jgi:propanol-preferring alcohol dehydrogenase
MLKSVDRQEMTMKAMILEMAGTPLILRDISRPEPHVGEVLIKIEACGVCRTDLHIVDGELTEPKLPLIPGHEIVGKVVDTGAGTGDIKIGQRVGVPWLGRTCGKCRFCDANAENLCDTAEFTGYTIDGGYAEYTLADPRYCFPIPRRYASAEAAPLLCAGLIGFRSYRMAGAAQRLGLYGFGAAAHILAQIAVSQGQEIYAFTRPGDHDGQAFARRLGAVWAGDSDRLPPQRLDAAILFAPVGALVPAALRALTKGGVVVCAGIHMSDIPSFSYDLLWGERVLRSVANLTREDGIEFFDLISHVPVKTHVETFPLAGANEALARLRDGKIQGAAVLVM